MQDTTLGDLKSRNEILKYELESARTRLNYASQKLQAAEKAFHAARNVEAFTPS